MKTFRLYLITVFSLVPLFLNAATLTGPQTADVGRMVTVESSVKGDWLVYPPDRADIAKDSGEKTLFLVARQEGTFTVIFFASFPDCGYIVRTKPLNQCIRFRMFLLKCKTTCSFLLSIEPYRVSFKVYVII